MSLVSLPQELYPKIFFNLNFKDLCQLPFVSKGLKELFREDGLWRNMFFTNFPNDAILPNQTAKKRFLARVKTIGVTDGQQLSKVLTSFVCNLKWNKKRELICTFFNEPSYSLKISQSFGPVRGTKEGSNGDADETEYYQCWSCSYPFNLNEENRNFSNEKFTRCPDVDYNGFNGQDPLDKNGIPLSIIYTAVCRPNCNSSEPEIPIPIQYMNEKISDVDMGFGNTLGYISEINEWKRPFKLFCITDPDSNKPVWVGLIPLYHQFNFVSIDSKGVVTREHGAIRFIEYNLYDDSRDVLTRNLQENPVQFS